MTDHRFDSEGRPGSRWYACYTRSRHEKKVDARLGRISEVDTYLPVIPREREWHDRRVTVEWPMFPGYVFARAPEDRFHRITATPGVVALVSTAGRPAPIPPEEIDSVRRLAEGLRGTETVTENPDPSWMGERVKVVEGPFEGVIGRVCERRGDDRVLLVGLEAIGKGVQIEIDAGCLELLDAC